MVAIKATKRVSGRPRPPLDAPRRHWMPLDAPWTPTIALYLACKKWVKLMISPEEEENKRTRLKFTTMIMQETSP